MKLKHETVLLKLSQLNSNWHLMPSTKLHLQLVSPQRSPSEAKPFSKTLLFSLSLKLKSPVHFVTNSDAAVSRRCPRGACHFHALI